MSNETAITLALSVMDAHIAALNQRDEKAIAETLHFLHFRLSGASLRTWETPETYFTDFRARAGGDWSHSAFNDMRILIASEDKVHIDAEIKRFDASGDIIISFRSLWIITNENGIWAAKFRSSFAPE